MSEKRDAGELQVRQRFGADEIESFEACFRSLIAPMDPTAAFDEGYELDGEESATEDFDADNADDAEEQWLLDETERNHSPTWTRRAPKETASSRHRAMSTPKLAMTRREGLSGCAGICKSVGQVRQHGQGGQRSQFHVLHIACVAG